MQDIITWGDDPPTPMLPHEDETDLEAVGEEPSEPEDGAGEGTNNLAQYFRDLKGLWILTPEEERRATASIFQVETELWNRILSYHKLIPHILKMLGEHGVAGPDLEALRQTCVAGRKSAASLVLIRATAQKTALAIHKMDLDREHIARALIMLRWAHGRRPSKFGIDFRGQKWLDFLGDVTLMEAQVRDRKNAFIKANLRLVVSIARRYNHGKMPLSDLIQEGNIGLMKAVDRFDHARGYRFSTYASWWIRHAISRGLADKGRPVRIPVHMLDGQYKLSRRTREMAAQLGRIPTDEELSLDTGVPLEKVLRMRHLSDATTSLDQEMGGDAEGRRRMEFIQNEEDEGPSAALETVGILKHMNALMGKLRPIEADILRQRFGVGIERELTLKEIGDKYNLSRERIRQLQEQALLKLRREMAKMNLLP